MEIVLIFCLLAAVVAGWIYLRGRLEEVEARLAVLEWREGQQARREQLASAQPAAPTVSLAPEGRRKPPPAASLPPVRPVRPMWPVQQEVPPMRPVQPEPQPTAAVRPSMDWEATLGGNWLNKLGVFIFVIGLALALGYSFTRVGPAGLVAISLGASFGMLAAGAVLEPRERYRIFARGLLGGGWAAVYTTVYAMQAIPAALVVHNALLGALLLMTVAAGMIAHSLRYRSQTVTGLAYFIAFATLAITQVTWLSALAVAPLAASLLFVAYRLGWRQIALVGLVATWSVTLLRGDLGAPLWQAQAVLALYWLLFEVFDLLRPDLFLLPLNAAGGLGLSLLKWQSAVPGDLWWFFTGAAAVYLVSALVRAARRSPWQAAATLSAALAAAAISLRLEHQWIAFGLLVEAELIYLTGVRLRVWYLRALGTTLIGLHLGHLLIAGVGSLPPDAWVPVAAIDAAVFYANRALCAADFYYGFAGAGMLALIVGYEVSEPFWGPVWMLLGVVAFVLGWWRRMFDFRAQGYALAAQGAVATARFAPHSPLALSAGAVVGIAAVLYAMRSAPDRFAGNEAEALRVAGSIAGTYFLADVLWVLLPAAWVAPALAGLTLVLVGLKWRWQSWLLAAVAFFRCWAVSFNSPDWFLAAAVTIACLYAAQLLSPRGSRARLYDSLLATALGTALIEYRVSGSLLTVAWGLEGVVLLAAGFPLRDRILRLSGLALLLACILKLFLWDLRQLDTVPRIVSFLVLGLILVGVSWIYTRFRERVARYL